MVAHVGQWTHCIGAVLLCIEAEYLDIDPWVEAERLDIGPWAEAELPDIGPRVASERLGQRR